jgi:hypothetical protein
MARALVFSNKVNFGHADRSDAFQLLGFLGGGVEKWRGRLFRWRNDLHQMTRATGIGWLFCVSVGLIRYHIGLTGGIFQVPLIMEGVCSFGQ